MVRGQKQAFVASIQQNIQQTILPGLNEFSPPHLLLTCLWQSSSHFVLCGVNVTCSPAALSPKSRQSLDQHLKKKPTAIVYFNSNPPNQQHSSNRRVEILFFRRWVVQTFDLKTGLDREVPSHYIKCSGAEAQREILLRSGQWCGCSPLFWHLPKVSHSALSSWVRSAPTYLKTCKGGMWERQQMMQNSLAKIKLKKTILHLRKWTRRRKYRRFGCFLTVTLSCVVKAWFGFISLIRPHGISQIRNVRGSSSKEQCLQWIDSFADLHISMCLV